MNKIFQIMTLASIILLAGACGGGSESKTEQTEEVKKFPEPTDSMANGLHPLYPTEKNIIGMWNLPDPTDTTGKPSNSYIEFMADKTINIKNASHFNATKWELSGNMLIMTHESGDPIEKGRMVQDTLVVEAVTDSSIHYYHLHEPNFLMHLNRKK